MNWVKIKHGYPNLNRIGKTEVVGVSEALAFGFSVATGFVAAGIGASTFQLLTNQRLTFEVPDLSVLSRLAYAFLLMFSGPIVLMRNGFKGWLIEKRHPGWLAATTFMATGWCFITGVFVLHMAIALQT